MMGTLNVAPQIPAIYSRLIKGNCITVRVNGNRNTPVVYKKLNQAISDLSGASRLN